MPRRLTPAGAAAIVDSRVKAREDAAQAERAIAAQKAAEERAWQAQFKKMLAAACEAQSVLISKTHPVRPSDLRRLGFQVWKEVDADNLSDLEALRAELDKAVKDQDAAVSKMTTAISNWVHGLVESPQQEDLDKEMTRLLLQPRFKSVYGLFDEDLLYDTEVGEIISSALESGEIRDWLGHRRHVKSVDWALKEVRRCSFEKEKIVARLQQLQGDWSKVDRGLTTDPRALNSPPPFRISWPVDKNVVPWDDRPVLSASSLTWIAGPGQLMLELLEARIADAANRMEKSSTVDVRYTNRYGHIVDGPNLEIVHFPPADDLNQILSAVGWKPDISCNPNQDYSLTLRW